MEPLRSRVKSGDLLIADGAMGTLLFEHLPPGGCPESLNLSQPELLEDIARRYVAAGADLVQSNSFGASPLKLAAYGLADRAAEVNRKAAAGARRAADGRAYVMGSCGPSGVLLKPYGEADPSEVLDSFKTQIGALLEGGADCISVETMIDLEEALLAVRAARELSDQIPVFASLTFDRTPRGFYTVMGAQISAAAERLATAGADVVGSNCGNGVAVLLEIAQAFHETSDLPLIIQANAGLPEMRQGTVIYPEGPEYFAEHLPKLKAAGVRIVGGCCGTTPAHIAALSAARDQLAAAQ